MGILDEAIKEHLELKRQHGAGASELKQLEDEAFGPPERPGSEEPVPDEVAEAPTEFMAQPEAAEKAPTRREPAAEIGDLQEAPQAEPKEPPSGPSTEEREAIADQPTELYDVEGELAASVPAPSEEELIEEGISEPRLAPVDALAGVEQTSDLEEDAEDASAPAAEADEDEDEEEDDDFFDEQRLSDELDQALEAPSRVDEEEQEDRGPEEQEDREPEQEAGGGEPASPGSEEDLLEETPDFLEEVPEDDRLWFEQKPPKDFDFDD